MPARIHLTLPSFGGWADGDWGRVLDLARAAEAAGMDGVVVPDHVAIGPRTDRYPAGPFPLPVDAPWLDPLTMLTAVAAVTERLRLGTGVLIGPARPPVVLAKTVATLDVLSGGRVDLGVGTGWQREELEAAGIPWAERGQRLTDGITACRALWEGDGPVTVDLPTVAFTELRSAPAPLQRPLPVLFSGTLHARNRHRIVELGDGWIPIMGATVADVRAGAAELRTAFSAAGRDPDALRVRAPVDADLASVTDLVAAGVTDLVVNLRHAGGDPGRLPDLVSQVQALSPA
ncbi:TIGR03619 family F420-dependent LLM class oxidoreductase [Iamia sp. SCSIO 61187]|uniref:TIGR03619 family F420-dependent LLM class oxidoreductase n=1 Tax=Iamia sp. SCSIO 61187 TaxID=2722752 RepID=UPI001C630C57|nr:TIGR03619 family F420-dependent LLM class oxidoreductase [Iamia sp. SCSIO 61187]QYG92154.1 TIGR03619 family F420-dependent LLM class oxidoreductase [Iamia sp. SCSIO 61187]